MKYEATFSENGNVMTRTFQKEGATERDVIDWFGLEEDDIDWYKVKPTN